MRCRRCGKKAVVQIRRHNTAFCEECFLQYFRGQVARAIDEEKMFTREDKVLVAVSGGKDSLGLWDGLMGLGYTTTGLYIHLGVTEEYSGTSREKAETFAAQRDAELIVVDLRKEYGLNVADVAEKSRRYPCSGCGTIKRYVFNDVALKGGFTVLATGHNLDDEAARLLGNILHWQTEYLAKEAPVLPAIHPKLVKKVKPLYRLSEYETATYAFLRGIDYIVEECPFSVDAKSLTYKQILNQIEALSPGTKHAFVFGFLKNLPKFEADGEKMTLRECARCGHVTNMEICSFCRLREELNRWSERRGRALPIVQVEEGQPAEAWKRSETIS